MSRYFKINGNTQYILSWKSKGLSCESIKPPPVSNNLYNPLLSHWGTETRVQFNKNCLKQSKISYTYWKIVNIYIIYEILSYTSGIDDPTLVNCLVGAVTLTKNADIDKYRYSGYRTGFDRRSSFSFPGGGMAQNVIILE